MGNKSPAYNAPTAERLNVVVTVRFAPEESRDLCALAVSEDRTRANIVRRLVKDQLALLRERGELTIASRAS